MCSLAPGCPRPASVFFIAIARAVVNHDGVAGTSLDPVVWSVGGAPNRRRVVHAVRDCAFLPVVAASPITCREVELWPYSVIMLVKWVAFLSTLHWPQERILGLVVSLMLSCSSFMSYGLVRGCLWRRLILDIFDQGVQFQCRLFHSVQALIFGVPVVSLVP